MISTTYTSTGEFTGFLEPSTILKSIGHSPYVLILDLPLPTKLLDLVVYTSSVLILRLISVTMIYYISMIHIMDTSTLTIMYLYIYTYLNIPISICIHTLCRYMYVIKYHTRNFRLVWVQLRCFNICTFTSSCAFQGKSSMNKARGNPAAESMVGGGGTVWIQVP